METFLGSPVLAFIHKWPVLSICSFMAAYEAGWADICRAR